MEQNAIFMLLWGFTTEQGGIPPQIEHKVETLTPTSLDFPNFWHAALFYGEMKKCQV